jgi:hypothetical protein
LRKVALVAALVLVAAGVAVALQPFHGSSAYGAGGLVRVDCGTALVAVNAVDTRPRLGALARLAAQEEHTPRAPPSAQAIARYDRLVASARKFTGCRGGATRRMTLADALVAVGIAVGIGVWWSRRARQRVSASAGA